MDRRGREFRNGQTWLVGRVEIICGRWNCTLTCESRMKSARAVLPENPLRIRGDGGWIHHNLLIQSVSTIESGRNLHAGHPSPACSRGRHPLQCRGRLHAVRGGTGCNAGVGWMQCRGLPQGGCRDAGCGAGRSCIVARGAADAVGGHLAAKGGVGTVRWRGCHAAGWGGIRRSQAAATGRNNFGCGEFLPRSGDETNQTIERTMTQ